MTTDLTAQQIWMNPTIMNFFFRSQARENFAILVQDTFDESSCAVLDAIDSTYDSLDEFEEICYNLHAEDLFEQIAEETGLTLIKDEDEEESEEE